MAFMKMLWVDGTPVVSGSWDYWKSVSGLLIRIRRKEYHTILEEINKVNNKIAYYAMCFCGNNFTPLVISPDVNAVTFSADSRTYTSRGTITDVNGNTWYWSGFQIMYNKSDYYCDPDCMLNDTVYGLNDGAQAAQDLLDKVFCVPFHEDYGNTQYVLNITDKRKTIRKAFGLWLAFNISKSNWAVVSYISDNVDSIISDILTTVASDTNVRVWIWYTRNGAEIWLFYGTTSIINAWMAGKESPRGLEFYHASSLAPQPFSNLRKMVYSSAGSPTITDSTGSYVFNTIGAYSVYDSTYGFVEIDIPNVGIDL